MIDKVEVFLAFLDSQPIAIKDRYVQQLFLYMCESPKQTSNPNFLLNAPPMEPFAAPKKPIIPSYADERKLLGDAFVRQLPIESFRQLIKAIGVLDYLTKKERSITSYELRLLTQQTGNSAFSDLIKILPLRDKMDDRFAEGWVELRAQDLSFEALSRTEASLLSEG